MKRELAVLTLTQKTFKKEWEGAVWIILAADFVEAFQQRYKCSEVGCDCQRLCEENLEIQIALAITIFFS